MSPDETKPFDISWWAITKIILVLLGVWLLWVIRDILVLALLVVVIVAAFAPVVDRWSAKMHRALAVTLLYGLFAVVLSLLGIAVVPPLVEEIQALAFNLPLLADQISNFAGTSVGEQLISSRQILEAIATALQSLGQGLISTTAGLIGGIFGTFTVIVLSFYLLLEEHGGRNLVANYLPMKDREKFAAITQKIGLKMGAWVRGQLVLAVVIGVVDFLILTIVGVPYALTLAILAGLMEFIPYIGPVVAAIPAVVLAILAAPIKGLVVLVAYVIVQQLEANILVPKIMAKAVGLSPVVIIFAILIGAKLAGLLGVVLAVPAAAAIAVLVQEWPALKNK